MTRTIKETLWVIGLLIFSFLIYSKLNELDKSFELKQNDSYKTSSPIYLFFITFLSLTIPAYLLRGAMQFFKKRWFYMILVLFLFFIDSLFAYFLWESFKMENTSFTIGQLSSLQITNTRFIIQYTLLFFTGLTIFSIFKTYRLLSSKK